MTQFYRYLRPLVFNFARHEVNTASNGGVCFRVLDEGEVAYGGLKVLKVSYSICHDKDTFDKDVAKRIADTRWNSGHVFDVLSPSVSVNVIAKAMIETHSLLFLDEDTPQKLYRLQDLRLLLERLDAIRVGHRQAWELSEMTRSTIQAIGIEKAYERIQGR